MARQKRIAKRLGHRPHFIRSGLEPREIYFPTGFLARVESQPGGLVEFLTLAISRHLQEGGGR